jgi:hypothetical protein
MITEVFINGTLIDIDKDEVIALTLTQFDLFDLAVRPSSYSNVFSIPKTQNNRLLFRSAGVVNSIDDRAYRRLSAEIKVDGAVIGAGSAELISSDGDFYRVNIKIASNDLFTNLKSLKLTDLKEYLDVYNHEYNPATVAERRDTLDPVVYPNVDYGFFDQADIASDQPFNFFFPALRLSYVFDSAFNLLGYKRKGSFFDSQLYNSLAIMAKGIFDEGSRFLAEYEIKSGFDLFVSRTTDTSGQVFTNSTPLNYTDEKEDEDGLYIDTDLGNVYVEKAYNFDEIFDVADVVNVFLNYSFKVRPEIEQTFIDEFIEKATLRFDLELWNKDTDTFDSVVFTTEREFYNFEGFQSEINGGSTSLGITFDSAVAADATNYVLLWRLNIITETQTGETVSTTNFFNDIDVESTFKIEQNKPTQADVSIVNSFDDINIGSAFLMLCNIAGLIPAIDEATRTVRVVTFDQTIKNKSNALDWSKKLDLSEEPTVSFIIDGTAKNNLFRYADDDGDQFLKEFQNFGQGALVIDNENLEEERVKYEAPYSLCPLVNTFNGGTEPRQMARIDTGDKYDFDGVDYNLIPNAKIDGFNTRLVFLTRQTDSLIQIAGSLSTQSGNYEVTNEPLLFSNILANDYELINRMFDRSKIVNALLRLNVADIATLDFSKPVYIDYFNDYFYVNEVSQFKVNDVDSTQVTLIRL